MTRRLGLALMTMLGGVVALALMDVRDAWPQALVLGVLSVLGMVAFAIAGNDIYRLNPRRRRPRPR